MANYKLFKGFKKLGEFSKISEAKKEAENTVTAYLIYFLKITVHLGKY